MPAAKEIHQLFTLGGAKAYCIIVSHLRLQEQVLNFAEVKIRSMLCLRNDILKRIVGLHKLERALHADFGEFFIEISADQDTEPDELLARDAVFRKNFFKNHFFRLDIGVNVFSRNFALSADPDVAVEHGRSKQQAVIILAYAAIERSCLHHMAKLRLALPGRGYC